jgi:hypothetical protein
MDTSNWHIGDGDGNWETWAEFTARVAEQASQPEDDGLDAMQREWLAAGHRKRDARPWAPPAELAPEPYPWSHHD